MKLFQPTAQAFQDLAPSIGATANNQIPLPNEIMAAIFAHCIPNDPMVNLVDPKQYPLLLLGICKAWQHLALSTPALWSTLYFDLDYIASKSVDGRLGNIPLVVDAWLTRARRRLLTVGMAGLWWPWTYSESATGESHMMRRRLLEIIQKHSPNIRHLVWRLAHTPEAVLFKQYPMDWGNLVELELVSPGPYDELELRGYDDPIEVFANAPLLRKISFTKVHPEVFDLPWAQLTHLSHECIYAHQCLPVLSALPSLVHCQLQSGDRELEQDLLLSINTYSSIKQLSLIEHEWIAVHSPTLSKNILGFMTLPALDSLDLTGADRIDADLLVAFLERSSAPLRRLAFHPCKSQHLASIKPFHLLPHLEELEIHRPSRHLTAGICQELASNKFLPRLLSLILHSPSSVREMDFIADQVGHALLAREKLVRPPLKSLRLVVPMDYGDTSMTKMSSALVNLVGLQEESGTKVYVKYM
ncbi:F-box domain-containing protein [Mycena indigotica]|uniref:F-box domain-containing protein n=1 Tax=Mycena indigotica TaxID=2126181 RepID=A0A8H6SP11_9AGAR|nr:F-box domain-containing protein [Mycena indigotica]KAF7302141.1 F-box domain-containing protein [Mycena indigotica]